eukprot:5114596-Amphidinium_carterae.3
MVPQLQKVQGPQVSWIVETASSTKTQTTPSRSLNTLSAEPFSSHCRDECFSSKPTSSLSMLCLITLSTLPCKGGMDATSNAANHNHELRRNPESLVFGSLSD